jgi:hypothetical protein
LEAKVERESGQSSRTEPDLEYARKQRNGWYIHLAIFAVVQGAILLVIALTDFDGSQIRVLSSDPETARDRFNYARNLWLLILIIDFFWSFSYTWWRPRMKGATDEGPSRD